MKKNSFDILIKISIPILILSFLNINIWTSDDTVTPIWGFIYKPGKEYLVLATISYIGIVLLISSIIFKTNKNFTMLLGLILIWITVLFLFKKFWISQVWFWFLKAELIFIIFSLVLIFIIIYNKKNKVQ